MTGFLDTNLIVRYLVGAPPALAERARAIIEADIRLLLTSAVIAEAAYVLMSVYGVPRAVVVDHLVTFIQRENIVPFEMDKGVLVQGLMLCRPSRRVSFVDALLWTVARSSQLTRVYSLDECFPSTGIEVRDHP